MGQMFDPSNISCVIGYIFTYYRYWLCGFWDLLHSPFARMVRTRTICQGGNATLNRSPDCARWLHAHGLKQNACSAVLGVVSVVVVMMHAGSRVRVRVCVCVCVRVRVCSFVCARMHVLLYNKVIVRIHNAVHLPQQTDFSYNAMLGM